MAADFDPAFAALAVDENVENAAAPHLRALLADESGSVCAGRQAVGHHESGERPGRASRCGILDDAEIVGEHPRIRALGVRRKDEEARRLRLVSQKPAQRDGIDLGAIDGRLVAQRNEDCGISRGDVLARHVVEHVAGCKADRCGAELRIVLARRANRRRTQPNQAFVVDANVDRPDVLVEHKATLLCGDFSDVPQYPSRPDGWVPGEHHLFDGREDTNSRGRPRALRWKDERRLGEICFTRNLLHCSVIEAGRVVEDGERVALERRLGEHVDDSVIYDHRVFRNTSCEVFVSKMCLILKRLGVQAKFHDSAHQVER